MCLCHLISSCLASVIKRPAFIIFRSWASGCWILLSSGDFVQLTITWMKVAVLISWTKICVIVPKVCFLLLLLFLFKHTVASVCQASGMCPSTVHKNRCSHDGFTVYAQWSADWSAWPWAEWRFTLVAIKRTYLIRCPLGRYFVFLGCFLQPPTI